MRRRSVRNLRTMLHRACSATVLACFVAGTVGVPIEVFPLADEAQSAVSAARVGALTTPPTGCNGCQCSAQKKASSDCCCAARRQVARKSSCCAKDKPVAAKSSPRSPDDQQPVLFACNCGHGPLHAVLCCPAPRLLSATPRIALGGELSAVVSHGLLLCPQAPSSPETPPPEAVIG